MNEHPNPEAVSTPAALPHEPAEAGLWLGYSIAAAGAILFSTKAIIIKLAYGGGINAETLLALRMGLALPFYGIIGWTALADRRRSGRPLPSRSLVLRAAFVGMIGYWFASYTDFLSLVYISAQFERLILFTYPAFVVVLGALFFAQPIRRAAIIGIAISYTGLALIFATKVTDLGVSVTKGAGLVLVAALAFALYQLLARELILKIGPRLFTCIAMSGAAAAVLAQFALTQPLSEILVSPHMLYYGVLIAIGATVLPSFLLNIALHRISAQANATIGTLSPVVTIALAVVVLGENLTLTDACGTALVLAGVGWFTLGDRKTA
jgi:drug/metabolite transporter (DMT)-like permease